MPVDVLVFDNLPEASHDDGSDLVDKKVDVLQLNDGPCTMLSLI